MKKAVFITVRTGSSRLPKKALMEVRGIKMIEYIIKRFKEMLGYTEIYICTTNLKEDEVLKKVAEDNKIKFYAGDPENIIKRHFECAKDNNIDFILNVDGDDILCSPEGAKKVLEVAEISKSDVIRTKGLPFGVNSMGYKISVLEDILKRRTQAEIDTGWGALIVDDKNFKVEEVEFLDSYKVKARMTLDYKEDFEFFKILIENMDMNKKFVGQEEIAKYLSENYEIIKINKSVEEKYWENFNEKRV